MKHQYEEYIKWLDEMIEDTGDDRSFYFNTAFRASLLANKATLEIHKENASGNCSECFGHYEGIIYERKFPCITYDRATGQLNEVMG